ncbi:MULTISPECIES: hypothetical protein [unclassified Microcoleus]|uniref:hypothetical protein n=1 Tax=unclassified Microcoleus TaxID=2642155 RepID=UPI002FD52892
MKQAEGLRHYTFLDDRPFADRFFLAQLKQSRSPFDAQKPSFLTLFKGCNEIFRKKPGTLECLCLIPEFVKLSIYMDFTIILMYKSTKIRY